MPSAVIRPASEEDISALLRLCNERRVPLTVRGAGTATTGAATPEKGGWVLDLSGWKHFELDTTAGWAYAQPGVILKDLQEAAEKTGWFYPPDPSSHAYCTVGGTLATNAGGLRAAKYGVTRDYVAALEGFMPTGEWVRWGLNLRKFASGYNIRDLWLGSEGTLGVITGAVLKLIPKPASRRTLLCGYPDEMTALAAVRRVQEARLVPSVLEFLDRQSVWCVEKFTGEAVSPGHPGLSYLLVEADGSESACKADASKLKKVLAMNAVVQREAADPVEAERLWMARRKCSPAMFLMGDTKLNEDVVVPWEKQAELLEYTLKLREETGLATPTFGHAADGNFHVHLMYDAKNPAQRKAAALGVGRLMEEVVRLGGAITGEHGIGLSKSPFLRLQHSEAEVAAMQRVKAAFDPNGILNPGKIFTPVEIWKTARAEVTFPWEHRR